MFLWCILGKVGFDRCDMVRPDATVQGVTTPVVAEGPCIMDMSYSPAQTSLSFVGVVERLGLQIMTMSLRCALLILLQRLCLQGVGQTAGHYPYKSLASPVRAQILWKANEKVLVKGLG